MKQEERVICFDTQLEIEAYEFKGVMQKFPNHFHEHYVIGFIESGQRRLIYNNTEYIVGSGDILLFNPLESHTCEQIDDQALDYRCLNIKPEIMENIAAEITGRVYVPRFTTQVAYRSEQVDLLRELHQMIMAEREDFEKEERFYFLIVQLIKAYTEPAPGSEDETSNANILRVCDYLEKNYNQPVTLDDLAHLAKMNKYSLLRSFTQVKGITPYRYLENTRINKAKILLEQGVEPIEAAMETGFSDQSHFTRYFKSFIGLNPGQYRDIFKKEDQ
ncbi:AraC family ligand binding domain-containing protein [Acetobacterium bakii]|uniref:AraC family transcriptional regulator n=1 Tax=Acetobacterium bakii TaxID=52689 RepID=A0A0L6U075_9FIRM|nr:AraC family transcriptional regulator [Acetobacterium bakii]KNZ41235.1 AraC family transcriptional regulator [Acetobacterium bakii]